MTNAIEKLVIRGDLSVLSETERSQYYLAVCEKLGLDPLTQPFAILKLNGKEVMYPTRGATDQLAAKYRLTRRIVEGPEIRDFAGTKLIYCKAEVSSPDGRIETSVATVPVVDIMNALMKCETKAKRRATLSILGLGMLDESEVESIRGAQSIEQDPLRLSAPAFEPAPVHVAIAIEPNAGPREVDAKLQAAWLKKIPKADPQQMIERASQVMQLDSPRIASAYVARWVELLTTAVGRKAFAAWPNHSSQESMRASIGEALDAAGVDARDWESDAE